MFDNVFDIRFLILGLILTHLGTIGLVITIMNLVHSRRK